MVEVEDEGAIVVARKSGQGKRERKEREPVPERGAMRLADRRHWLIANNEIAQELLTVYYGDEEALLVFSFPEEAEAFLRLGGFGSEWWIKASWTGELASLLSGPCAGVERVALDPLLPSSLGFVSLDRKGFMRYLLGGRELRRC